MVKCTVVDVDGMAFGETCSIGRVQKNSRHLFFINSVKVDSRIFLEIGFKLTAGINQGHLLLKG